MPFVVFVGVGWPSRGLASQARPLELLVIFRVMCAAAATGTGAVCAVLVYIMDGANRAPPRVDLSGGGGASLHPLFAPPPYHETR